MNKKEQIKYTNNIKKLVQENGLKIGYFLEKIGISRSHWQFLKKGERPLTEDNKNKIDAFLSIIGQIGKDNKIEWTQEDLDKINKLLGSDFKL